MEKKTVRRDSINSGSYIGTSDLVEEKSYSFDEIEKLMKLGEELRQMGKKETDPKASFELGSDGTVKANNLDSQDAAQTLTELGKTRATLSKESASFPTNSEKSSEALKTFYERDVEDDDRKKWYQTIQGKIAIFVAVVGFAGAIGAAVVTGLFGLIPDTPDKGQCLEFEKPDTVHCSKPRTLQDSMHSSTKEQCINFCESTKDTSCCLWIDPIKGADNGYGPPNSNCWAYSSKLKSGCPGCTEKITYATSCTRR